MIYMSYTHTHTQWQPTPVSLPEEFRKQRSLTGYSPWGHRSLTRLSNETTTLTREYHSAIKKNEIMLFAAIWVDLEIIILSEVKPLLCFTHSVMTDSFAIPWAVAPRLLCPWDFLGKNIGVDCHFLLQGIFPTQRSNPCLHVSCSAGGFFIAEPLGKPKVKSRERQISYGITYVESKK